MFWLQILCVRVGPIVDCAYSEYVFRWNVLDMCFAYIMKCVMFPKPILFIRSLSIRQHVTSHWRISCIWTIHMRTTKTTTRRRNTHTRTGQSTKQFTTHNSAIHPNTRITTENIELIERWNLYLTHSTRQRKPISIKWYKSWVTYDMSLDLDVAFTRTSMWPHNRNNRLYFVRYDYGDDGRTNDEHEQHENERKVKTKSPFRTVSSVIRSRWRDQTLRRRQRI